LHFCPLKLRSRNVQCSNTGRQARPRLNATLGPRTRIGKGNISGVKSLPGTAAEDHQRARWPVPIASGATIENGHLNCAESERGRTKSIELHRAYSKGVFVVWHHQRKQHQEGRTSESDLTRRCSRRITLAFLPFVVKVKAMCNVPIRAGKRARG
jgi:hypothetical protein